MRRSMLAPAALLALAACGGPGNEKASTAPGSAVTNGARAGEAAANPQTTEARQYVALAAAGDMFEMQSARLALQRSQNAQVRGLAQMILADHQRSATLLAEAGALAQPAISPTPVLAPGQQASLEALQRTQGPAFDREWLHQQVLAHQQALDLAAAYARGGDTPALRTHAAATIAPIQTHLTRARRLEAEALAAP